MPRLRVPLLPSLACCLVLVAGGCARGPSGGGEDQGLHKARSGATRPIEAVLLLSLDLRADDLPGFVRDAVPPDWRPRLDAAWRAGRTRWPLQELPFDERLPAMLGALAAPGSEARLQQVFDHQFAGAGAQIKGAAASLGLFGAQYVEHASDYSDAEREQYAQLVAAASRWGMSAPLADRERAHMAIAQLAAAARAAGLRSEADFRAAGMDESLRRMGPVSAAFKRVLAPYGIDLDASLDGMQVTLQEQTGDTARVRMRYTVGAQAIDAVVPVQRIDGRWYLSDYLRHAGAAIGATPQASR